MPRERNNLPGPTRRALSRLGIGSWEDFASLSETEVAALPLTSRDIDALGLDADEGGESLLRDASTGRLVSWRMPESGGPDDADALPDAEAE